MNEFRRLEGGVAYELLMGGSAFFDGAFAKYIILTLRISDFGGLVEIANKIKHLSQDVPVPIEHILTCC